MEQKTVKKMTKNNTKYKQTPVAIKHGGGLKSIKLLWGIGAGEVSVEKTPHKAFQLVKVFI